MKLKPPIKHIATRADSAFWKRFIRRLVLFSMMPTIIAPFATFPARAESVNSLMNAVAGFLGNKCDDIVADFVVEVVLKENNNDLTEEERRNLHKFQQESERRRQFGGSLGPFRGTYETEQKQASELTDEEFEKLKEHVIQIGERRNKTVTPQVVGQNCSAVVTQYGVTVSSILDYKKSIRGIESNETMFEQNLQFMQEQRAHQNFQAMLDNVIRMSNTWNQPQQPYPSYPSYPPQAPNYPISPGWPANPTIAPPSAPQPVGPTVSGTAPLN